MAGASFSYFKSWAVGSAYRLGRIAWRAMCANNDAMCWGVPSTCNSAVEVTLCPVDGEYTEAVQAATLNLEE